MAKPGPKPRKDKPAKWTLYLAQASIDKARKMAKEDRQQFSRFIETIIDEAEATRKLLALEKKAQLQKLRPAAVV